MAELKILGAGPVKRGVTQVAALFEKSSGHRVVVEFVGAPLVRDRILAGEAVDVAIVPAATMDEFVAGGKVAAESRAAGRRAGALPRASPRRRCPRWARTSRAQPSLARDRPRWTALPRPSRSCSTAASLAAWRALGAATRR